MSVIESNGSTQWEIDTVREQVAEFHAIISRVRYTTPEEAQEVERHIDDVTVSFCIPNDAVSEDDEFVSEVFRQWVGNMCDFDYRIVRRNGNVYVVTMH